MRLTLLLYTLSLFARVALATSVMGRPDDYKRVRKPLTRIPFNPVRPARQAHTFGPGGKVNAAYFTNWGIYARQFTPHMVDPKFLTHIFYAFADTNSTTGEVIMSDIWADEQILYPGDDTSEPGINLYGNLKQLFLLKKNNRQLKLNLSVGGWTFSTRGDLAFVTNSTSRTTFVQSLVKIIEDYGFDGCIIDWEYPQAGAEAEAFVALLRETRAGLDAHAKSKNDSVPYELDVAVAAGAQNYQNLLVSQMNEFVSYWHIMAYEYSGSWSEVSDHNDNVYGGELSGVSTNTTARWYVDNGAERGKIIIGSPLFGNSFANTDGFHKPFSGSGPGTWEQGVYDYKALPLPGCQVTIDWANIASYCYSSSKRELVSYDTPSVVRVKAGWVGLEKFAGIAFWEVSGDKNGTDSLIWTSAKTMAVLDDTPNHLNYPGSKFANLKAGMPGL